MLAATLSAAYGIYGPAFELVERRGLRAGSEEYLDSEKYQLRTWDTSSPDSLEPLVTAINAARRAHPALQSNERLEFRQIANDMLIAYTKHTADLADVVLGVVNLDPHHTQSGWVELPLERLGIDPEHPYQVHDLLDGETYTWQGPRNFVELDPDRQSGTPLPRPPAPAQRARLRVLRMIMPITMPAARTDPRPNGPAGTGTRTRSSTRCTSAPSPTPTATASATSAG